jgi:DNA-binding transcriptional ArsR family regulator
MPNVREEQLDEIADRFKALAEPARLRILNALRGGELTVGELVESTGLNQANLSKHLQLLHTLRFVARRKDGLFVRYRLVNNDVFVLCDIMCGATEASGVPQRNTRRTAAPVRARR